MARPRLRWTGLLAAALLAACGADTDTAPRADGADAGPGAPRAAAADEDRAAASTAADAVDAAGAPAPGTLPEFDEADLPPARPDVDDPRLQAQLDANLAGGDPMAGIPLGQANEEEVRRTGAAIAGVVGGSERPPSDPGSLDPAEAMQVLAELGKPGLELTPEQQARLQAANDTLYGAKGTDRRLRNRDRMRRDMGLAAIGEKQKADWLARQPADWKLHRHVQRGGEADLVVRVGDIDNLGFGWPVDFDPFSGASTPPHAYPFAPDPQDPDGTDRIMVISGHAGGGRSDGYTERTRRPDNAPRPLRIEFDPDGLALRDVQLQLFVDDFQAPSFGNRYRVLLDGREAPHLAEALNTLRQRGPIGKLLTLQLLPEQFDLLADGRLDIAIDDPDTDAGDGFAIDFVRLLVNPGPTRQLAALRGRILDKDSREPLPGALASAAATVESRADAAGDYRLDGVPAGLAVVVASHAGYQPATASVDLEAGATGRLDFLLEPREETSRALEKALKREGRVDLYGLYFDTGQATLKPESEATLAQVLALMQRRGELRLVVAGHTDDQGERAYNEALSQRRAAAVVAWLVGRGIAPDRLGSEGHGESRPVASNATAEGRARNRRVEIRGKP